MSLKKVKSKIFDHHIKKVISETIASQLPGRQNGGAADAYRHILLSAELTRLFGSGIALGQLNRHESDSDNGADNGLGIRRDTPPRYYKTAARPLRSLNQ